MRRHVLLTTVAALVAVLLASAPAGARTTNDLRGTVRDGQGEPLAGVTVGYYTSDPNGNDPDELVRSVVTGADGTYLLEDLSFDTSGQFTQYLRFIDNAERYPELRFWEDGDSGDWVRDVTMLRSGSVVGSVRRSIGRATDTTVSLTEIGYLDATYPRPRTKVAADGTYRFTDLRPGRYHVRFTDAADQYLPQCLGATSEGDCFREDAPLLTVSEDQTTTLPPET
ncbi:MAG: hypothetical protein PGN07_10560, partial [Aeromicrobium erythreum]